MRPVPCRLREFLPERYSLAVRIQDSSYVTVSFVTLHSNRKLQTARGQGMERIPYVGMANYASSGSFDSAPIILTKKNIVVALRSG